jgi:amino acid permease
MRVLSLFNKGNIMAEVKRELKRSLKTIHLWGIAVGLVISGEYFGWSYGWDKAGTLGFMITSLVIAAMYTTFIFSYTELTTSIPHAGGPFAYARRAFGPTGGYIAGMATRAVPRTRPKTRGAGGVSGVYVFECDWCHHRCHL